MEEFSEWTSDELEAVEGLLLLNKEVIDNSMTNKREVESENFNNKEELSKWTPDELGAIKGLLLLSENTLDNSIINEREIGINYDKIKNHREIKKPKKYRDLELNPKSFPCELCGKHFNNGQALGGHKKSCNRNNDYSSSISKKPRNKLNQDQVMNEVKPHHKKEQSIMVMDEVEPLHGIQ
jgi:hypothetical protein